MTAGGYLTAQNTNEVKAYPQHANRNVVKRFPRAGQDLAARDSPWNTGTWLVLGGKGSFRYSQQVMGAEVRLRRGGDFSHPEALAGGSSCTGIPLSWEGRGEIGWFQVPAQEQVIPRWLPHGAGKKGRLCPPL